MSGSQAARIDLPPAVAESVAALFRTGKSRGQGLLSQVKVGIDFDSTIARIDEPWLARLNKVCQTNYRSSQWTDWDLNFLKEEERRIFFKVFTPDLYETVEPYAGAIDAIRDLAKKPGVRLVCVTTNPSEGADAFAHAKISWLRKYFPDLADSVLFSKKKSGLGLDVLVDDAPHHFDDVDYIPVLVERPWNTSVDCALRFREWNTGRFLLLSLVDQFTRTARQTQHTIPSS